MVVIRVVVQIDLILITTIVCSKEILTSKYIKEEYVQMYKNTVVQPLTPFFLEGLNVSIKQNYIQYRTKYIQLLTQWEQNHVNPNLLLLTRFMKKVMIHISIMVGSSFVPDNRIQLPKSKHSQSKFKVQFGESEIYQIPIQILLP